MESVLHPTGKKGREKAGFRRIEGRAERLLDIIRDNPYRNPPPYEKLTGDLTGTYSRRINIQHRLVYQVIEDERAVKVLRLWTHYE